MMTDQADSNKLLSAGAVKRRYGDISDMTLWRWLKNNALKFPRPIQINRRRYWQIDELVTWELRQPRSVAKLIDDR